MRPVLIATLVVCVTAVVAIGVLPLTVPLYMGVGFIAGLSTPPVQPAVRTIYPKMVNSRQLTPLFSLDASAQEIIWVVGPVVTTFVVHPDRHGLGHPARCRDDGRAAASGSSPRPSSGACASRGRKRRFGVVLARPAVLLATIVGFLLIGACAAVEAGVVAAFGHDGSEAGIVLAIFSIGSLAGGLFLGHVPIGPWATARRMLIVFVGVSLAAFAMDFWWLAVTLFIAGIGIAPALAVLFAIVSASVKFSDTAEAYGWVGTGQLIGAALGSALAGFLIDGFGAAGRVLGGDRPGVPRRHRAACSAARGIPTSAAATRARSPTPNRCRCNPVDRCRCNPVRTRMSHPVTPAPRLSLADGAMIPQLGFGLYKVPAADAARLSRAAIEIGYRHLDTAAFYDNEEGVGEAVRTAGVPREELFVTSKVWKDDNGYDSTLRAFDASIARLGLDVLDLYLIHWPVPSTDRYVDTWRALIRLREEGRVRSIGVANFHAHHVERIIAETGRGTRR